MGRQSIIVIENFYSDPDAVRDYAFTQQWYDPYAVSNKWRTTWWKGHNECPFKSSASLIGCLQDAVGEHIDMQHWQNPFPLTEDGRAAANSREVNSCLWNCSLHVKHDSGLTFGKGIHNHVIDKWNCVGIEGWAGLLYLNRDAPLDGGLHLWQHTNPKRQYEWMSGGDNWRFLDKFANLFNRLILVRGGIPHSGTDGWGSELHDGRMFQTFFFKTLAKKETTVSLSRSDLKL
jgi:hypothetical protein